VIPPPVRYDLIWTDRLIREAANPTRPRQSIFAYLARVPFVGAIFILGAVSLGEYVFFAKFFAAYLAFHCVLYLLYWLFCESIMQSRKKENGTLMHEGVTTVTLGADGIEKVHPVGSKHLDWPRDVGIVKGKIALHLMFSPKNVLPIPYDALPEEVTPEELRRRISIWRVSARK